MLTTPLRARGLCFAYEGSDVLHDVDLALEAGAITAIIGANGSGKSTLIEILAGLDVDSRERVRGILADEARRGRAIGWVTHDRDDIAHADRLVHLVDGRRVA